MTNLEGLASKAADYLKKKVGGDKTKGGDALWAYIEEKKTAGLNARRPFESIWLLDMAFVAGKQYVFFNSSAHEIQKLEPVRGRIRMMDNQLMPRVRRQVADFIKNDPEMSVVPSTTEDEDIKAARAGDKFLKSFWQSNRMKKKVRQLGGWQYITGNAFADHRWNKKLGPIVIDEKTGKAVYSGDVDVEIWSPFEIVVPFVAMGATEIHEFPWIIKMRWRNLEWFEEGWERGGEVKEEKMTSALIDTSFILGGSYSTQGKGFPGALSVEFYQRPNKAFPKGIYCLGANGIILETTEYPYDRYNLEQFKDVDIPGQFWGKATMEDAIPLQKTWNQTLSDIYEFNRTMGRGKYLIPERSNLRIEFDNVTGQHIYYKPVMGLKPELLSLKGLPTSFTLALEMTWKSLDNLFSQHEVTQGTNKSDIRSGEMVSLLREQDAHGAIPSHQIFEESLENLMAGVLKRVQKGYDQPRMIDVVGRDNDLEAMSFAATDLKGNTNVMVKKQSSLPDSRMAREARTLDRFEKGLYGNIQDPSVRRQVMVMLEDAVVKDIYSSERKDEAVANWENTLLTQIKMPINNYDNHSIHLRNHTDFQKGMDYQKLKMGDRKGFIEMEARFLEHMTPHQKFIQEQIAMQIQQQRELDIGGGGKSGSNKK